MISLMTIIACTNSKTPIGTGGPPSFEAIPGEIAYISVEDVFQEIEAGKSFYILDARPTNDYDIDHIEGAYSLPFYEVEQHFNDYPVDEWYIAYCGCPHSESGIVAEYFLDNGHTKIGILDEGYLVWKDEGYPIENGS
jgi:cytochrome c oxidase cbb3-type subunit 3